MGQTTIEWTDKTWNPVRGCTRVSEGCRHCYAERQAARYSRGTLGEVPALPFHGFAENTKAGPRWTGRVELIPNKLAEPLAWREPARVFVNSMSDLFHEALSFEDVAAVFGIMAACPHLTFQVLTKRPERAREFYRWLGSDGRKWWSIEGRTNESQSIAWHLAAFDNVRLCDAPGRAACAKWPLFNLCLGTSVENQPTADERIPKILGCPAAVHFVSYEPALGPVDFDPGICPRCGSRDFTEGPEIQPTCNECGAEVCFGWWLDSDPQIDWLIVGGESGPGARPFDLAWARSAVEQCKAAGVACFVKQLGARPIDSARMDAVPRRDDQIIRGEATPAQLDHLAFLIETATVRLRDRKGGEMSEWPAELRVRQFPEAVE
jgi:protein gp37